MQKIDLGELTLGSPQLRTGVDQAAANVPEDANIRWDSRFGIPGIEGQVFDVLLDGQGNLYAAGDFTTAGEVSANNVVRWDGAAWHPLGLGTDGIVYGLALGAQGELYAAGNFAAADGVSAHDIARWDGSAWHPLGEGPDQGVDDSIRALVVDRLGNLYAAVYYNPTGADTQYYVARWDGLTWHSLGSGMDAPVNALAVDGVGNLYAGGWFTRVGGTIVNYVARWDGSAWQALGSGTNGPVNALASDEQGNLYAGGSFCTAGGVSASGVARWDGSAWHSLREGSCYPVVALASDEQGNLYASGYFSLDGGISASSVARWDGLAWYPLGIGTDGVVVALVPAGQGGLYAGGDFTSAGGLAANSIARWNGNEWQPFKDGIAEGMSAKVFALAADEQGNMYAGGSFTAAGSVRANRIARWDGSAWHPLGAGLAGEVRALAIDAQGNLYAGGDFAAAGGASANHIARWDGLAWQALGSGTNGPVNALAVDSAGNLYAGGDFTVAGGVSANYIARWDGSGWHSLGAGLDCDACYWPVVLALAVDGTSNVYVGGHFSTAGGISANNIARWDGLTWQALADGLSYDIVTTVHSLASDGQEGLYAGGNYEYVDGKAWFYAPFLVHWDGANWSSVAEFWDNSLNSSIDALAVDAKGDLYAGGGPWGLFWGDLNSGVIGRWDGVNWYPLGDGIGGGHCTYSCAPTRVLALAFDGQAYLFVGGEFSFAGIKPSYRVARWETTWAADDRFRTPVGQTLEVPAPGVLENDELAADAVSVVLEEGPATGDLEFNPDGSFIYAPEDNYLGPVTFQYRISPEDGGMNVAEVILEVYTKSYLPAALANCTISPATP